MNVFCVCVCDDFSVWNKRPQTRNNGWCESIAQIAVDLLRDRQHENNDQPSNYAIGINYEILRTHCSKNKKRPVTSFSLYFFVGCVVLRVHWLIPQNTETHSDAYQSSVWLNFNGSRKWNEVRQ